MFRSYCSNRFSVRISSTSRKPSVVTKAVRATAPLDQRVCRKRRSVNEDVDVRQGDPGGIGHRLHAGDDGPLRRRIVGENLGGVQGSVEIQGDVGKSSTDVDPDAGSCVARCFAMLFPSFGKAAMSDHSLLWAADVQALFACRPQSPAAVLCVF